MSMKTSGMPERQVTAATGTPNLIFWMLIFALLPAAALLGGMRFLLVALALGLAAIIWARPREAPGVAMLYLFAAGIILPWADRFQGGISGTEMYYWAAGLLIITFAAVLRVGPERVWMAAPRSAKVFLAVATVATLYGWTHGASLSYALRQYYGAALLVVYLGIAMRAGSEEILLRRIATFGVVCALCFVIYYAAIFSQYGFHRETGTNGSQAASMAVLLLLAGIERGKKSWVVDSLVLMVVPILLFMRRDVLMFLFALTIAFTMKVKSKKLLILGSVAALLLALTAVFPPITQLVASELQSAPVIGSLMPAGGRNASSLVGRVVQLDATVQTLQAHPLLGVGMGGDLGYRLPKTHKFVTGAYVDNGWAYLLQKTGLLGLAAFLWFVVTVMGGISRRSLGLSACLLSAIFVVMFSEPIFLHFTTAPFLGAYAGLLLAQQRRRELAAKAYDGVLVAGRQAVRRDSRQKASPHRGPAPQGAM